MFLKESKNHQFNVISFTPPVRHDGKQSYISFSMIDPVSGRMKRKKYMLDKYAKGHARNIMAAQITANIYNMVQNGWNPWVAEPSRRGGVKFLSVIKLYGLYIANLYKKGAMRAKTKTDYLNRLKRLSEYIEDNRLENMMAFQVNTTFIVEFLDYVLLDRDVSPRTRNNYRTWLSAFCKWMIDKMYIEENPVASVNILSEGEKHRQPLTVTDLKKLSDYLYKNDKHFLLAVMFQYYTLIRPTELTYLKLKDISVKKQSVYVSHTISKNKHDANVGLNDKIIKLMIELHFFDRPGNYYIFGKTLRPSDTRCASSIFRYNWSLVRKALNWSDKYQFYSLKDSGIRDLANAEGVVVARDQARHSDISTTNLYLQGRDRPVDEKTKHFNGNL